MGTTEGRAHGRTLGSGKGTHMQILIAIHQAEALRRGIDAPSSTAHVEVDPAVLLPDERELLASILREGHDATRETIRCGQRIGPLRVVRPTVEDLRQALREVIDYRTEQERLEVVATVERERETIRRLGTPRSDWQHVALFGDGQIVAVEFLSGLSVRAAIRMLVPTVPDFAGESAAVVSALKGFRAEREREQAEFLESQRPALELLAAEKQRETDRKLETLHALSRELPEVTRERRAAGYCDDDEWYRLLTEVATAGLESELRSRGAELHRHEHSDQVETQRLTDVQFSRLRTLEGRCDGLGLEVGVWRAWDVDESGDAYGHRALAVLGRSVELPGRALEVEVFVDLGLDDEPECTCDTDSPAPCPAH